MLTFIPIKKTFHTITLITLIAAMVTSCGKTVDYKKEKEYYKRENGIIYYKGSPFSGTEVEYYDNGQLLRSASFNEGKPHGKYLEYYENGQLRVKAYYKNGEIDGVYESYYRNGQLEVKAYYKNGETDGVYESYDENGQLREKAYYKNGEYQSSGGN